MSHLSPEPVTEPRCSMALFLRSHHHLFFPKQAILTSAHSFFFSSFLSLGHIVFAGSQFSDQGLSPHQGSGDLES